MGRVVYEKSYDRLDNSEQMYTWFDAPEGEVWQRVFAYGKYLRMTQSNFYLSLQRYGNMYEEKPYFIYGPSRYTQTSNNNAISLNVISSCIDTLYSKITKNTPSVMFVTNQGDYVQQQKAQDLTDFMKGLFYASDFDSKAAELFHDGAVYGTGVLQPYYNYSERRFCWERILPFELICDLTEGCYREPRQLHKLRFVHRHSLAAKFKDDPNKFNKIMSAPVDKNLIWSSSTLSNEMITVFESWYLASEEGMDDGRYCMTIDSCDLEDHVYPHSYFPFLVYRYKQSKLGYFGIGVAEELKQIQYEMNYIARTIQTATYMGSIPKIFIQENSIISSHLDNSIGTIVKTRGLPSQSIMSMPLMTVPNDLYKQLEFYRDWSHERVGVSELSSQSKKPAGLNSGRAIDTYLDAESDRFSATQRAWEKIYKEAADMVMKLGKEIVKEDPSFGVMSFGKNASKRIKFQEIDLEKDSWMMKDFPVSKLPDEPAELLSYIQTLLQSGFIDQATGLELLELPDVSYALDIQNAQHHACLKLIGEIVEAEINGSDDNINIDPLINLQLLLNVAQNSYLYYKYKMKVPEEVLNRILVVIEQCKRGLDIQMQQEQMMQAQTMAMAQIQAMQGMQQGGGSMQQQPQMMGGGMDQSMGSSGAMPQGMGV